MAHKSKLEQILETYSEEEIRRICAESGSRTDFTEKLGISPKISRREHLIEDLGHLLKLDYSHFKCRQKMPSKSEFIAAYEQAQSMHHLGELLGLSWKNKDSERKVLNRLLKRYECDGSRFKGDSLLFQRSITRYQVQLKNLDSDLVQLAFDQATSLKEFAILCDMDYLFQNEASLSKLGRKIANYFGYDATELKKRPKNEPNNKSFSSWLYHNSNIVCSQCHKTIDNIGFLSDNDVKSVSYARFVLCPECHAKSKETRTEYMLCSCEVMNQKNMTLHGVYLIRQKSSSKIYVGQTSISFYDRMWRHIRDTSCQIDTLLNADTVDDFEFYILEIMNTVSTSELLQREAHWINLLGANNPLIGLNSFRTPNVDKCILSDIEIRQLLEDLQLEDVSRSEIAQKYGIATTTLSRIKSGQSRRLTGVDYPVLSFREQKQIKNVLNVLNDLIETELTLKEISEKYSISYNVVKSYNKGAVPAIAIPYISNYSFPIRSVKTPRKDIIDVQKAFRAVLQSNFRAVATNYQISDNALKKIFKHYELPTTYAKIRIWLDNHPDEESRYRVPSKDIIIAKTNECNTIREAQNAFHITSQTFESWLKHRNITILNKEKAHIYCEELNYETQTVKEMALALCNNGISQMDKERTATKLYHALKRNDGCCFNLHFSRIEKPLVE